MAINAYCPSHSIGRLVPTKCSPSCALVFLKWYQRCRNDTSIKQVDRAMGSQLSPFNALCAPKPTCGNCSGQARAAVSLKVNAAVLTHGSRQRRNFEFDFATDVAYLSCVGTNQITVLTITRSSSRRLQESSQISVVVAHWACTHERHEVACTPKGHVFCMY